ncbi:YrhB domain-containing protein [Nonomuraea sp. NPDC047529]|uniref:YrhB domain-containing protein n=1 Tax=Nonomuraea sp. NPDC047529 TaxID=3155623 RepID=UPI0033D01F6A
MDRQQATLLAERYLAGFSTAEKPLALYGDESVDDLGWCFVFPWNTARFIETRDFADVHGPGYGPVVVVKESGDTWMMNGLPEEQQLAAYAARHGISPDHKK